MKLVIDIGNSYLKWATVANKQLTFGGAHFYKNTDVKTLLATVWQHITPNKIAVANVGGQEIANTIAEFANEAWQKNVEFVHAQLEGHGIKNHYATPLLLGADRWADVIAAWQLYKKPLCVFDAGTSITTDIVDREGKLLGGTISPGLNLMCDALVTRAANLKHLQGTFFQPEKMYQPALAAKTTYTNISDGVLLTAIGFLEQSARTLEIEHDNDIHFLVTGGDAIFLMPHLSQKFEHHPYLALQGIDILSN